VRTARRRRDGAANWLRSVKTLSRSGAARRKRRNWVRSAELGSFGETLLVLVMRGLARRRWNWLRLVELASFGGNGSRCGIGFVRSFRRLTLGGILQQTYLYALYEIDTYGRQGPGPPAADAMENPV
jgi:hypothetical protein